MLIGMVQYVVADQLISLFMLHAFNGILIVIYFKYFV